MEEIEKRFEIIGIAIDLSDHDLIGQQVWRLRNLSTDKHLHEILRDLESRNYRQALYEMRSYSQSVKDDFFGADTQPKASHVPHIETIPDETTDDNDLFDIVLDDTKNKDHILSLDEMLEMTIESKIPVKKPIDQTDDDDNESHQKPQEILDPLFSLDSAPDEEVLSFTPQTETKETEVAETEEEPQDIDAPLFTDEVLSDTADDMFVNTAPEATTDNHFVQEPISKKPLADTTQAEQPSTANETQYHDNTPAPDTYQASMYHQETPQKEAPTSTAQQDYMLGDDRYKTEQDTNDIYNMEAEPTTISHKFDDYEEEITEIPVSSLDQYSSTIVMPTKRPWDFEPDEDDIVYEKFAYMSQKFRNMLHKHPQIEEYEDDMCEEATEFIDYVSHNDYAESQVEAMVARYQELEQAGERAKAAHVLIAAAATESTFAQFMLARELFKGHVLQQNYPEAFTQINHLAEEDYPEAICDLGQLYEYGIGIDKDKNHALLLYQEAANMGVERAETHYERLKGANPLKAVASLFGRKKKK